MKCAYCRQGETVPGVVTTTLQRGETTIIIKGVPAHVCDVCGEYYLDAPVAQRVVEMGEAAVKTNAEVQIIRFAA